MERSENSIRHKEERAARRKLLRAQIESLEKRLRRKLRILLVDDNFYSVAPLIMTLKSAGHIVTFFSTAVDATKDLSLHEYDLVILDWIMPEKDGAEVIRDADKKMNVRKPVPVITYSALDRPSTIFPEAVHFKRIAHWKKPLNYAQTKKIASALPEMLEVL